MRYGCVRSDSSLAPLLPVGYGGSGMSTIRVSRPVALGGIAVATFILTATLASLEARDVHRIWNESTAANAYVACGAFAEAVEVWLGRGQHETIRSVTDVMASGPYGAVEVIADGVVIASAGDGARPVGSPARTTGRSIVPQLLVDRVEGRWIVDASIPLASSGGLVRTREDVTSSHAAMIHAILRIGAVGVAGWATLCALIWGATTWWNARRRTERVGSPTVPPAAIEYGSVLAVDRRTKSTRLNGSPVALSPKQFELLALLASDEGRVFSDRDILGAVWPGSPYADANDVRQCVYQLRRRLDAAAPSGANHVGNVKGFGYRLVSSLPLAPDAPGAPSREEEGSHVLCEQS